MHIRTVEWLKTVPRSIFPKDILFSMNSALTVFKVYRNDAENRVNEILALDTSARIAARVRTPKQKSGCLPRKTPSISMPPHVMKSSSSLRISSNATIWPAWSERS